RNVSGSYIVTAHKIAIYVIQHFITINIAVIVGCWNGLRMIIIYTRYKTAHHKGIGFKGLMYWWRLVNATCDRFKIVNRKRIRIIVTVITYDIKWMRSVN